MDVLPFAPIELVAIDPARNMRRRWSSVAARDLFGATTVETGWGRIGARGRTLVRSFDREWEALAYVRALLARRGRALRRIGVGYAPAVTASAVLCLRQVTAARHGCEASRPPDNPAEDRRVSAG